PTHHRRIPRRQSPQQTESLFGATLNAFIDSIGHQRTSASTDGMSALPLKADMLSLRIDVS
ncbi:MAG: hypothetical protein PVJ46_12445, partial [Methyloceanibacter sp.]